MAYVRIIRIVKEIFVNKAPAGHVLICVNALQLAEKSVTLQDVMPV